MAFFGRTRKTGEIEVSDEVSKDIDIRDDALANILRVFGEQSFPVRDEPPNALKDLCDQWARHILIGAAAPGLKNLGSQGSRYYAELRQFFSKRRNEECQFVQRSVSDFKGTILDVVDNLRELVSKQSREDREILELLSKLADSVKKDSIDSMRERIQTTVKRVSETLEKRERERQSKMSDLGNRVQKLSTDLQTAKEEATTDPLTQVKNRKGFDEGLKQRLMFAELTREPLALLLIDIDHFKNINDKYGHPKGDEVLKVFADELSKCFPRKSDLVARYGGEEFAIVLLNCTRDNCLRLVERCMDKIRQIRVSNLGSEQPIAFTASIGASFYQLGEQEDQLIRRADECLYQAKRNGRNRFIMETSNPLSLISKDIGSKDVDAKKEARPET